MTITRISEVYDILCRNCSCFILFENRFWQGLEVSCE